MKLIASTVLVLAAMAGSANAACSTAAMAGKWTLILQDGVCVATVQTNGNYTSTCSSPPTFSGRVTVNSSCVVTGTANGQGFKGRTNPIPAASSQKPTLMLGASTNGNIAFTGFRQ